MNRTTLGKLMTAGALALGMQHSFANPTGGQVVGGSAAITTVPGTVTINQATNIAIINWQTFSISSGELTKFVQPSSSSAALNRVLGGQTSFINGTLSANGQVFLINGNGIVVGAGGLVNTNSFVASTRDIADSDFLSGNYHFTGSNTSGVVNQGTINALGGDVYLIGKTVDNQGTINAPNGTAGLAAGDDVLLNLSGEEHVFVSPSATATAAPTQTAVQNSGTIAAASAELKAANGNLYALAINNAGTIRATSVSQQGGRIFLTTDAGLIQNIGTIAAKSGSNGGSVKITGGSVWNQQTIDASGANGGDVTIDSQNVQNDGTISVKGTSGTGGSVAVTYSGNALGSVTGLIDASGTTQGGSIQILGTGATSEAYLSLALNADSSGGSGGSIDIDSPTLYLTGATLTADGATQGGDIFIGEDNPASTTTLAFAQTVYVSLGTSISADATSSGNGGQIGIVGSGTSDFYGSAEATGKGTNGEVNIYGPSSSGDSQSGSVDLTDSIDLTLDVSTDIISGSSGASFFEFVDPDPSANDAFGRPTTGIFNLSTDNTLITSPGDTFGGAGAGAAYLFSDSNGALLSTIRGSHAGDAVGTTVLTLTSGNFAIETPNWDGNVGAITFGNGTTGFADGGGAVSSSNSLIGSTSGDEIGSGGLTPLANGNYIVSSPDWNGDEGAVTSINPTVGAAGVVSAENSLVGSSPGDAIGSGGIMQLSNEANFLVLSPSWSGGVGAVTNESDSSALTGTVTPSNSLVGSSVGDGVGAGGSVTDSGFGFYLVTTPAWSNDMGAVTWNADGGGVTGAITSENSLVGTTAGDQVGSGGVTILSDENYVVASPEWENKAGAVTWGSGSGGISGVVSASNSLVGATSAESVDGEDITTGDQVGSGGIETLSNGNYLILSPLFGGGAGAVTWVNEAVGIAGVLDTSNSLVGDSGYDHIDSAGVTLLADGNYLVDSPEWNNLTGAVTWGSGSTGVVGFVGSGNSLLGASAGDQIGSGGIFQLSNNANYLVLSPLWSSGAGAITDLSSSVATSGVVTSSNSLVGAAGDAVGTAGSITDSLNGYFLATTLGWGGGAGAVTWSSDTGGTTGAVSASNSLVGTTGAGLVNSGDQIGSGGITILGNGDYVVASPEWENKAGAVTWGSASGGLIGVVSASNSLVGATSAESVANVDITTGDQIGSGGIESLSNGNYLVLSPLFGGGAGAVTWANEGTGITGTVDTLTSLIGDSGRDHVGSGGITLLADGNYVVSSPDWNSLTGAVTWGSGLSGVAGFVGSGNSLVGAAPGDAVGTAGSIFQSTTGYYLVRTSGWNGGTGAVTWNSDANGGVTGAVSASNSLTGAAGGDDLGSGGITILSNGNYVILSPQFDGGSGAATFADGNGSTLGQIGISNSLVGANSNDHIGSGGVIILPNGNYLVQSPLFDESAGAVTWGSGTTGITGQVSTSNSITGGGPDSGEEYAGLSADGSIYLVAFTTDTSEGGDGRVIAGSVDGTSVTPTQPDFFMDQAVITFETAGFTHLHPDDSSFYICNPGAPPHDNVGVDALTGGALNDGHGNNIATGSSTALASGPKRLVTPINGIWNIVGGTVHSAPPPAFISNQLQFNLSPAVFAHLHEMLFGHP